MAATGKSLMKSHNCHAHCKTRQYFTDDFFYLVLVIF